MFRGNLKKNLSQNEKKINVTYSKVKKILIRYIVRTWMLPFPLTRGLK